MREFSIPALAEVPDTATLTDVVFGTAASAPDQVTMRRQEDDGAWSQVSARQLAAEVRALAKGLIAAGIEPGDRVAIMSRTSSAWTITDYAIWTVGGVTVPVYETSSAEQVEWILSDSGAKAVFAETAAHAAIISDLRQALPDLGIIAMIGETAEPHRHRRAGQRRAVRRGWQAGPPATWRPSSIPQAPPGARRAASSPTATCCPAPGTRSRAHSPRSSTSPAARLCCSCRWPTRSPGSSRSAAWSPAPSSCTGRTLRR